MSVAGKLEVAVTTDGSVGRVSFDLGNYGGRLPLNIVESLTCGVKSLSNDENVAVIVIGSALSDFCLGRDRSRDPQGCDTARKFHDKVLAPIADCYKAIQGSRPPIVCLVKGQALGIGTALACTCDIVLATHTATFGFTELSAGVAPLLAMSPMVGRISGAVLGYLAYSAEPIDTSRAMQFGLVSRAFSEPRFDEEAEQFLALLASRNRSELAAIKSLIRSKENGATIDLAAKSFAVARF